MNNRNNKTSRFNVARDNNINCIIYKFIQKYGFKTYFYENISIKSNVFQKIRKFIMENYYHKSLKENTTRKSKRFESKSNPRKIKYAKRKPNKSTIRFRF